MKLEIKTKLRGNLFFDQGAAATQVFHEELSKAFNQSLRTLRDMVRARAPVGASSTLRHSIFHEMKDPSRSPGLQASTTFEGRVFVHSGHPKFFSFAFMPCTYGPAVEFGTKPHFPPMWPLNDWVIHKFPRSTAERELPGPFRAQTYKIAWSIKKKGTKAHPFFAPALDEFDSLGILESNVRSALDLIAKRINVETPWWAQEVPV